MEWISIADKIPNFNHKACFICGHEWFGIGIWENDKGWTRAFVGEFPHGDDGDFITDSQFLNDEVMYWNPIFIAYPVYGTRGSESPLMKKFMKD